MVRAKPVADAALCSGKMKSTQQSGKLFSLLLQRFGGGSGLLHQRRVLLCYAIHLSDRLIHLFDAGSLLYGCSPNFRYDAAHMSGRVNHLVNVFIWPENAGKVQQERSDTRNGYNLESFQSQGMDYWLVSDLNKNELKNLAQLLANPRK
jgi:hypothetical protein